MALEQTSTGALATPDAKEPGRADQTAAGATLAIVGAATLLVLVVFTTVITTVTETAQSFHAGIAAETWALGGMSLGLAGALLTAGALADALGRRRVFVLSGVALAASSALATAAPSMLVFVVARILQGVAGAGLLAAGLGLIGQIFAQGPIRTHATGIWAAMLSGGIVLGPILGAGLESASSWRSAYGLEALAAVALVGASRKLPESRDDARPRRLDSPGALTMLVAMTCLTGGVISGRSNWTSTTTLTLLLAGVAALAAFVAIEARRRDPMLDLGLLRRPLFLVSIGGAMVSGLATVALMSYAPTLLQRGLDQSALAAGGILAVWSLTSMLVAAQARRLPDRIDARQRLIAGLVLSACGSAALAGLGAGSSWRRLVPGLFVAGLGSGLANAALARLAVESVPSTSMALGSSANNTARYLGSALGIALIVAIVSAGGAGTAGLVDGWNHAALATAAINIAGAALALAIRPCPPASARGRRL